MNKKELQTVTCSFDKLYLLIRLLPKKFVKYTNQFVQYTNKERYPDDKFRFDSNFGH